MSIGAKPWEGGSAASVPDASETVKGKIRIATSAEATTGTNDLTAMTPLTVKERIDAALVGGLEYQGTFNATTGLPSLANAEKGDLYRIATGGTIYGQDWSIGDHLIINADMGGSITNSKIDKVDNTDDDASETVKGIIEIATSAEATAGTDDLKAMTPLTVKERIDALSLGTASTQDVGTSANNVVQLDGSARLPAVDGSQLTNLPAGSAASETAAGIIEIATSAEATAGTDDLKAMTPLTVKERIDALSSTYQPLDAGLTSISGLTTAADKMIFTDGSDSYDTTDLTAFARSFLDDANATTARSTLSLGTASTEDVGTSANNVVQLDGSARLPAVDGSQLTNLPSGATALNDLTDVTITGASTGEVLRYSGAAWVDATLAYSDLSGTPTLGTAAALDVGTSASNVVQLDGSARLPAVDGSQLTNLPSESDASETVKGIIEIATNAEAQAASATDKALVPSNIGSIDAGDLNDDGTYLKNLSEDSSPQLGANLDLNSYDLVTTSNADLDLAPNGTGVVVIRGNTNSGALKLNCENNYPRAATLSDRRIQSDLTYRSGHRWSSIED